MYTKEILEEIDKKKNNCLQKIVIHENISNRFYRKHIIYGLPQIIIPITMTFASQIIENKETLRLATGIGFLLNGICTCFHTFFDFKVLSLNHERASFKYIELTNYINTNLLKVDRISSNLLLDHVSNEMKNLECYSPSTQNVCISDCCLNKK